MDAYGSMRELAGEQVRFRQRTALRVEQRQHGGEFWTWGVQERWRTHLHATKP